VRHQGTGSGARLAFRVAQHPSGNASAAPGDAPDRSPWDTTRQAEIDG